MFGHSEELSVKAERWLAEQIGTKEVRMALHKMEGFDEVLRKLLRKLPPEQRMAGLAPEQRVAGLAPEQVLAAYKPEQVLAVYERERMLPALPVDVLRGLSADYLDSLPEPTRAAIRARIAGTSPKAKRGAGLKPGRVHRRASPKRTR